MMMDDVFENRILLGWKEWASLPEIGIPAIKVKVDSGARTSALHAYKIDTFYSGRQRKIRFSIHPLQKRTDISITCETNIIDRRRVSDSGGHYEMRYVIKTPVCLGGLSFDTEITLTDRESMRFRMLLGRTAMAGRFAIDPAAAYLTGRTLKNAYKKKTQRKPK